MSTTIGTLKDNSGNDFLPITDVSLVSGLEDIASIRSGAAAGATAYQLPSGGIPASDLASGVIPNVPVQDVTVDNTSIVVSGVANIQTMTTTELNNLWNSI